MSAGVLAMPLTAWKVPTYGVFSGPFFPVFNSNAGKYGQEKNLYLGTFSQCLQLLTKGNNGEKLQRKNQKKQKLNTTQTAAIKFFSKLADIRL